MITLKNINLSSIDLSGIDLRGIKLGLGGRGGGSGDGFPQLPGDVTRWHFGGLTNEMMAAMDDPRIEDADHKGRFLSFKNFAWGGMSGVNGYVQNFNDFRNNATVDKIRIDEQSSNSVKVTILTTGIGNAIYIAKNVYQFNKSYFIKISSEGYNEGDLSLSFYAISTSTATTVKVPLNPNGITEIPAIKEDDFLAVYLNVGGKVGSITIEQLPLYPGALVFDGVDDSGVCDNFPVLTKEKGYTVVALRQWINNSTNGAYLVSNAINNGALGAFIFERDKDSITYSFGRATKINVNYNNPITYQISNSYNSVEITMGTLLKGNDTLLVGVNYKTDAYLYANVAIWELVFLDHDATEEELTKIKDYFVKTYPWLFPDQAWTVTGKTNEDEDRDTIANITGNGNDLVLSNFGFAERSGYGSYFWNFKNFHAWNTVTEVTNSKIVLKGSTSTFWGSQLEKTINEELHIVAKVKVTGLTDEMPKLYFGKFDTGDKLQLTNGINNIDKIIFAQYGWYGFGFEEAFESCNVTIEQIPEYEGYLVTDGVDDMIKSSAFELGKDFTVVGEWEFINKNNDNAGLVKYNQIYIYNRSTGLRIYLKQGATPYVLTGNKVKSITSDGRLYDENWNEYNVDPVGNSIDTNELLKIGYYGDNFTQLAFKNLAIYNNQILSKDDCIKAYNYLQTLKAK